MEKNEPKQLSKGLVTDSHYMDQPKGTTSFVLNGIHQTREGSKGRIVSEEGNELRYTITAGYIPLGKVYVGDGNTVLFSVKEDETLSEIGMLNDHNVYTVLVNHDLGFRLDRPIKALYRLRRGCERVLYWVDPKLRTFNIDKPENHKTDDDWDNDKFRLYKTFSKVPTFDSVEVLETGTLLPGSYNAVIQYVDTDLNPTEWITGAQRINIWNDRLDKEYPVISGSSAEETPYRNYGRTSKSIRYTFGNLDTDYAYYRLAFVCANSGTGQVSQVLVTDLIPIGIDNYTFTGTGTSETVIEEIQAFSDIIESAETLEQIENMLIIGGTKGKDIDYCALQKYASKIKADCTFLEADLNHMVKNNPKTPTVYFDNTGYMPGEIYSFGLSWLFDDGSRTPVYHIPGKNHDTEDVSFTEGGYPMSIDNEVNDGTYLDNGNCTFGDYWGTDSEGVALKGKKIRHHRFPSRAEAGKDLVTRTLPNVTYARYVAGINTSGLPSTAYKDNNEHIEYTLVFQTGDKEYVIHKKISSDVTSLNLDGILLIRTDTYAEVTTVTAFYENGVAMTNGVASAATGVIYNYVESTFNERTQDVRYTNEMFGIRFSGITKPPKELTGDREIVGYYILRQERRDDDRTILDTGVLVPLLDETNYVGHAHMFPNTTAATRFKKDIVGLVHPELSFNKKEYQFMTSIEQEGSFTRQSKVISDLLVQDVMAGTSFDPDVHKARAEDTDGFDLHMMARDNFVTYSNTNAGTAYDIEDVFYLDSLDNKAVNDINDAQKDVFNLSCDNRVGIIKLGTNISETLLESKLPYVVMKRDLDNPYVDFRTRPYYKEGNNPILFRENNFGSIIGGDQVNLFKGDVVTTSMRYTTSAYYDTRIAIRATKTGLLNYIIGAIAIVVGVVASIFTAGASLALVAVGIAAIGYGVSSIATGIKKDTMARVWIQLYEAGLKDTVEDTDTVADLEYANSDDEIQWFSDTVTNLWFESTVNMAQRQKATANIPSYLDSPDNVSTVGTTSLTNIAQNEVDSHLLFKLTNLDPENGDGRLYQGFANAELYEVNPDYTRRNDTKIFFHLPLEYDCCSECKEDFPKRYHYSQQSFQEELTDNYRVFLPNNYRELEGGGDITNIFRYYDNLYIHTREALWLQPKNFQERVTDEVVSFIGTGSFFEIPPKKVVDNELPVAGLDNRSGVTKTEHGVLFPNMDDRKIYLFTGKEMKDLSRQGNSRWFRENMDVNANRQYYDTNGETYPYHNMPEHPFGTGFLTTYDPANERLIVTKRDFTFAPELNDTDYRLVAFDGELKIFRDYKATLATRASNGWEFMGVEGDQLKFKKATYGSLTEQRYDANGDPLVLETTVFVPSVTVEYEDSETFLYEPIEYDLSWTMSYSLENGSWTSWHSYLPNFYFFTRENFYGFKYGTAGIWAFNVKGLYNNYFGTRYPHIVEYVSNQGGDIKTYENIILDVRAEDYDPTSRTYVPRNDRFYNKFLAYNSNQMTGVLFMRLRENHVPTTDFMFHGVVDPVGETFATKVERNYMINDLRNNINDHTVPMFLRAPEDLDSSYFIDKVVNPDAVFFLKDWFDMESLRDKFLVIRLIMDNFDDTRLITNYSIENELPSK